MRAVVVLVIALAVAACTGDVAPPGGVPAPDEVAGATEPDESTESPDERTAPPAEPTAPPATDGSERPDAERPDAGQPVDRVLRGDESFADGFTVPAGEVWEFQPDATTTVVSRANVVVKGVLRMRPSSPDVVHTLQFAGVDESRFVGGGHHGEDVPATDVGLWVVGDGQLDIEGTRRAGWNRTGTDPTWRPDDEIRVAPTAEGDSTTFAEFAPGGQVPTVSHAGDTYAAEVLNLTRNVRIQGTGNGEADPADNGRAHIWINSTRPQSIRYAELRHLGPRQAGGENPTEGVLGRYPLHFHLAGEGTRGSIVEGVVVRDSGNRAFVPHGSHGITFRDTIAFNVFDDAYWWDPDDTGHGGPASGATNDLVYEHAMAAMVRFDPEFRGYVLSGFVLGEGENVSVTDSVAVGVQGNVTASGFHWPASANGNEHNVWQFTGNVAHNNNASGIFVWQNDSNDHRIEDFVGYRNGEFGVDHGAYSNNYAYDGVVLFGNGEAGIRSKAAADSTRQQWRAIDTDSILIAARALDSNIPIVFEDVTLRGKIIVDERDDDSDSGRAAYEFRNVRTADGSELSRDDFDVRHKVSKITVFREDGSSFEI